MTCPVCLDRPCTYGNSMICSCCGNLVCGFCSQRILTSDHDQLKCPVCRNNYNTSVDVLVSNLEKTCQRDGNHIDDAKVCLGAQYFRQKKFRKSRRVLESLGDEIKKYKGGYYYLAMLYRYGLGGPKKPTKAFKMFLDISSVGRSLFYIGEMFILGEGTEKNKEYGSGLIEIQKKRKIFPIHYRTGKNIIT